MSENEKLRALLAEARERIGYCPCGSGLCEQPADMVRRIDAALAEPVRGCESCGDKSYRELLDDNVRVRAERDEARAEVERLRDAAQRCEQVLSAMLDKWTKPAFERGEHLPALRAQLDVVGGLLRGSPEPLFDPARWRAEEVRMAFKRGAEAMREAAVQVMVSLCEQAASAGNVDWANRYLGISDEVLSLPVPEDR